MRTVFPLIFISAFFLFACTGNDPNLVTITGEIANPIGESVAFINKDTTFAATTNEEGNFNITFALDSAGYFDFEHGMEISVMYIKPGDKIHLTLDTRQFDETIKYEGSNASSFLAKKYLIYENTDFYGRDFYLGNSEEYKTFLDELKKTLISELETINDNSFINSETSKINEYIGYFSEAYEGFQDYSTDYGEDVRLFMMKKGELMDDFDFYEEVESLTSNEFNTRLNEYSDGLYQLLSQVNNEDYVTQEKEKIDKLIESWRERKAFFDAMPRTGEPAVDFTYPDKDGNELSLSSFKGSLVYVDVWATWCGPCIAEIPALKKLEKEYHGQNLTFVSVSVDRDKNEWLKMLEEDQLGGIQLWADGWSQITKDYAIFGIPRFMLISKEGNIISNDAPRPSSPDIRKLLDENL